MEAAGGGVLACAATELVVALWGAAGAWPLTGGGDVSGAFDAVAVLAAAGSGGIAAAWDAAGAGGAPGEVGVNSWTAIPADGSSCACGGAMRIDSNPDSPCAASIDGCVCDIVGCGAMCASESGDARRLEAHPARPAIVPIKSTGPKAFRSDRYPFDGEVLNVTLNSLAHRSSRGRSPAASDQDHREYPHALCGHGQSAATFHQGARRQTQ